MIAQLRGVILEKHPNQAIIDAGGVGYELTIPVSTYSALAAVGEQGRLHVHTHVREDALQLFGFSTPQEKKLFEKLISVSGVGPKLAVTILSGLAANELIEAIRSGDLQTLVRIPGIGKKTAERLVLELREKLEIAAGPAATSPKVKAGFTANEEDVISALMNIGAARPAAEAAILKAKSESPAGGFEELFRVALRNLR